jgi:hypothetical protein
LELVVSGLVASFEEHVMSLSEDCGKDKDELLAKVVNWNNSFFPPKMIREGILNKIKAIGVNYLSREKADTIYRMNNLISKILKPPSRLLTVMKSLSVIANKKLKR